MISSPKKSCGEHDLLPAAGVPAATDAATVREVHNLLDDVAQAGNGERVARSGAMDNGGALPCQLDSGLRHELLYICHHKTRENFAFRPT